MGQNDFPEWAAPAPPLPAGEVLAILGDVFMERSSGLGEHSSMVAHMCGVVAPVVGLPDDQHEALVQAAFLHDVGKLSLPDSILEREGALSEAEWSRVRRHTILGERILVAVGLSGRVLDFVRSSHERMDGEGYPDGLAGDEIPLGARIIAVCDAYSAMTMERPYRTAMTSEAALRELARSSGAQFDPAVVEVVASLCGTEELVLM